VGKDYIKKTPNKKESQKGNQILTPICKAQTKEKNKIGKIGLTTCLPKDFLASF